MTYGLFCFQETPFYCLSFQLFLPLYLRNICKSSASDWLKNQLLMATIKVVLDKRLAKKDGTYPLILLLRITHQLKSRSIPFRLWTHRSYSSHNEWVVKTWKFLKCPSFLFNFKLLFSVDFLLFSRFFDDWITSSLNLSFTLLPRSTFFGL